MTETIDDRLRDGSRPLTGRLAEAFAGAAALHAGQTRKGTAVPYIAHLMGVTSVALYHGADEDEAIAALLHDAIEDAPEAIGARGVREWIGRRFGPRVLAVVEGCTDADETPKPPWLARKRAYIAHVTAETSPSIVLVSASDKLHNVNDIRRDFDRVGDAVFDRFKAGQEAVIGYYRGLVDAFRATGHHATLVEDLHRAVSDLERATGVTGMWPPRGGVET